MSVDPGAGFLAHVVVVDQLPAAFGLSGRMLADLGADVYRITANADDDAHAASRWDPRWERGSWTWDVGRRVVGPEQLPALLERAEVRLRLAGDPAPPAPHLVDVVVSPFGLVGPKAGWLASDLGVAAASGNLWPTGDPDRPPVRCAAPLALVHAGPEAALAALFGLARGVPGPVDVSMAEALSIANLGQAISSGGVGRRGARTGATISGTREIWPCRDGWVSFGLRGGKARQDSLEYLSKLAADQGDDRLIGVDWEQYSPTTAAADLLATITDVFGRLFSALTLDELTALAVDHKVLVAPILDAAAITRSAQLAERSYFIQTATGALIPGSFLATRRADGQWERCAPSDPARTGPPSGPRDAGDAEQRPSLPFAGTRIVEFGSGVAGPLVGRYFAEQGATVIRVESSTRPDFLRIYSLGPSNPHGLEGSPLFAWANTGKLGVTLDLKNDDALRLARRLVGGAHAMVENFTPGTLERLGLGFDDLITANPALVLLSMGFQGQTGPRRTEAGFGALGSALSGYNSLTGWPDREPIGPAGTITDSLAPRFGVVALAAALLAQRRGAPGVHLDISQVEATIYSLSPWLATFAAGAVWGREGNASPFAVPHGLFPAEGDDRWVAIAVWSDDEWSRLRETINWGGPPLDTLTKRIAHRGDIEKAIAAWTATRPAADTAALLQARGVEAVPVDDYCDLLHDGTLQARRHFVETAHNVLGTVVAERSGYRLSDDDGGYERPSPSLGRDNRSVFCDLLGLTSDEYDASEAAGAIV
jgi:crotonobetainyl-CoA:carnitine CoA-transferase CaiB-like acyl-CoA transferase